MAGTWDKLALEDVLKWLSLHQWPAVAALLLGALLAAWLVDLTFRRLLTTLARRWPGKLNQYLLTHLRQPMLVTAFLLVVQVGLELFLPRHPWRAHLISLLQSLLVVLWATALIRLMRTFLDSLGRTQQTNPALARALPLLNNLITVVLVLAGMYWLLQLWGVSVAPLLASAGIATAAVALASKDTLANFFGGVSIFVDRPYSQGDYILLPGGERGEVVRIGVRSTRVLTRDDVLVTVPNAEMANSKIINESGEVPRFRLRAAVGVAYDSDLDQVEAALIKALEDIPEIMSHPEPRTRLRGFGDSALEYELLAWVERPADRGLVLHRINRNIFNIFKQQGIQIPFPQRVVHLPPTPPEA
ncbi:MAG: mechanosensitive ion channel family protein [Pseudomonadota bacterium]